MIPLKLQIKNFLSYGSEIQTIDFGPYPLICLSGKNGHGKSALLDAMTWALWGQARKAAGAAKADQGLLRLGQTQMMVIFDFELNSQRYRVRREYAQTYGKPYANLEFGVLDPEKDTLTPLSDKTIRATQAIIEQTLHLDFDAFANSAFLRQGNANEFSKKSAKDRKEILANILGLDQYETIRKRALEKIRNAGAEKQTLCALNEKIGTELENKNELQVQLKTVEHELAQLNKLQQQLQKEHTELSKQQKKLSEQQKEYELIAFKKQKIVEDEMAKQQLLRELLATWRTVLKKQRQLPSIADLEKQKKALVDEINLHQKTLQKQLHLKEQYLKAKQEQQELEHAHAQQQAKQQQKQNTALERLKAEQHHITQTKTTIENQQKKRDQELKQIDQETQALQKQCVPLEQIEQELAPLEQHFERRKEHYQKYIAQGNLITSELQELHQKETLVHDENDPSCPLCEQNLSASRRRFLKQKFEKNKRFLTHQRNRLVRVVKQLKALLVDQHAQITELKKKREQKTAMTIKIAEYTKQQEKINNTLKDDTQQLNELNKKTDAIAKAIDQQQQAVNTLTNDTQALHTNTTYKKTIATVQKIELELKSITYNETAHQHAQQTIQTVEQQVLQYARLQEQINQQDKRKQNIHTLCSQLRVIKKDKKELEKKALDFATLEKQEAKLNEQSLQLQNKKKEVQEQKETLLQQKARTLTQQEKLKQIEQELKEQAKTIKKLETTIQDYQAIATATSKDGIQALLIEDAIPEIEQEANNLLAKLTNNQAHILIESLRDLKKGGTKETLDINISDAAGIRPYELFSGGEAFRIDFALRIAISKLLARRAGTALQTLIIDEGFGSQDEEGLALIMDAIYKIQDDFAKVIIVSHLPLLKDLFPVHFMVEKGPNGSTVKVIELG